jgi:hypothetical protein
VELTGIESGETSAPNVVNRRVDDAKQVTQDDERRREVPASPMSSDDAIRVAAKAAIDANEYDRARALLELLNPAQRPTGTSAGAILSFPHAAHKRR